MAKPRPVSGIRPDRRMRPNARLILATRIEEVWSYSDDVTSPGRVRELHDMRIAFKRLRYLLEIFGLAFPTDLDPFLEEVKDMQDILGDIHDRDVQVPMLQEHLDELSARDDEAARELVRTTEPTAPGGARRRGQALRAFTDRLSAESTADQRPGILALLDRRTRERDALYERFLTEWRRLADERFRERLEEALGIE